MPMGTSQSRYATVSSEPPFILCEVSCCLTMCCLWSFWNLWLCWCIWMWFGDRCWNLLSSKQLDFYLKMIFCTWNAMLRSNEPLHLHLCICVCVHISLLMLAFMQKRFRPNNLLCAFSVFQACESWHVEKLLLLVQMFEVFFIIIYGTCIPKMSVR